MQRLLLALLLVGCATTVETPERPPTMQDRVCAAMEVDCTNVPEATVIDTDLLDMLPCFGCRYRGVYLPDENIIYLNRQLTPEGREITLFHELVHYISTITDTYEGRCENEELARKLTAIEFNLPYDDKWKAGYRCDNPGSTPSITGGIL